MPTLEGLPAASTVNLTDKMLIDQGGTSLAATVAQVLGTLPTGPGLVVAGGTLAADTTLLAPLASPALQGTPTAPTPAAGDNSTRLATTAFVLANAGTVSAGGTLTLAGDVAGSGSGTIEVTLPAIAAPGTYDKVTVNAKGQVTAGAALAAGDITAALGFAPAAGNAPITLDGDISGSGTTLITATLPSIVTPGSYDRVSVDAKGRVTAGFPLAASDVALALGFAPIAGNQTITLGGDLSGAGATAIAATLAPVGTAGTYTRVTTDAKGRVVGGAALGASDVALALGFAPIAGNQTITLAGDLAGSGTTSITATLPSVVAAGLYQSVTVDAKGRVIGGAALTAAEIGGALGYAPVAPGGLGTLAAQNAATVAITGGSVGGADISGAEVTASGATTPRSPAARAADFPNVLDFGADPTGVADCGAAFAAAMAAIPPGAWGQVRVPRGTYRLNGAVNQPSGKSVAFVFDDGANITGPGYLGVDRVESTQGPYKQTVNAGGWFGFAPSLGAGGNPAFDAQYLYNTPQNSLSMRVGKDFRYTNSNIYGKYHAGIDIAEQRIHSWPNLYDNSSGWGLWEVIEGTTLDEDSAARAGLSSSCELSETDIVNNGPEAGWTWKSGFGNTVQGMSIDPWGQNGLYGGSLLFAYGSVGSFDGNGGGLNQRWVAYPAAFSNGNPGTVAANSTVAIEMDLTAKATASLLGGGVGGVSVGNGGGAYGSPPAVVFTGGGGSGAAGSAVMLGGAVVGVTITDAGAGYAAPPAVSFSGGGVATPATVTVTLNPDGAHGDLASIAAAINAAAIANVRAAVAVWGGVVSRLVVFGTNPNDLGTLTLGGSALGSLGIAAQAYATPRGNYAVVIGGSGPVAVGDKLSVNGHVVTVGGAGAAADVAAAVNAANLPGIAADTNADGQFVLTAFVPQNPAGLVLANPSGYATLGKLALNAGTFWPPVPPKAFATAASELTTPVCLPTDQISISATDLAGNIHGPVTVTLNGGDGSAWPAPVAASIVAALTTAGFYSADFTALSQAPAVVAVRAIGTGGNQGVAIRNTAGGTLTLTDAHGTPLETLGIPPGIFQPGGGSAGSQSVFMAAADSIAPQGRGVFVGGASSATDRSVWPATPLEARGSFLHGLRLDHATIDDNVALRLAAGQSLAWGAGAAAQTLAVVGGTLEVNGAALAGGGGSGTLTLTGDVTGAGSGTVAASLAVIGTPGTYEKVTVDDKGRVIGGAALAAADIGAALGYAPLAGNQTITLSGDIAGSGTTTIGATLASIVTAGTYDKVTVDAKGRVTAGSALAGSDITAALGFAPLPPSAIPAASAGAILAASGTAGVAGTLTLGANLSLTGGTTLAASGGVSAQGAYSILANATAATALPAATAISNNLSLASGTLDLGGTINVGTATLGSAVLGSAVLGNAGGALTVTVAQDAAGYHPMLLAASGTYTNVPFVLAPAGAGYLAAALSNGAVSGGNQRGQYAVDWQQVRSGVTHVASGVAAVVTGGAYNVAAGNYAIAGGYGSSALGLASVSLGSQSSDHGAMGKLVFSGNAANGQQFAVSTLQATSVAAAKRMTTDGATAGTSNSLPIVTNHVIGGTLTVTARNVSTGDAASWSIPVLYKNSAGTVSVTTPGTTAIAPNAADSTLAAASVSIAADATNKGLAVTITPPSGVTLSAAGVFVAAEM